MRRVLVTGASGAVAPPVVAAFQHAGWQVSAVSRRRATPGSLPVECVEHTSDLFDEQRLGEAMAGANAVVHLAGLLHILNAPASLGAEYRRVNVEGTRRVLAAARAAGVSRVVLASTITVYGPSSGRALDETAVPHPDTAYAASKLEAEQLALSAAAEGHPDAVVLRLAAVYGGRVKGNYERLVKSLAKGRFVPIGPGTNHRTLVHEDDAGRACVMAAEHPGAAGRILNVTDGTTHTVAEINAAICRALGRRAPRWSVPVGAARVAAAAAGSALALIGRRSAINGGTLTKYLEDVEVSGDAMIQSLGFRPEFDLMRGWAHAIEEMRRLGRI